MRIFIAFLISPLVVSAVAPLAIEMEIMPYPSIFLVGTIPVVYFFTAVIVAPIFVLLKEKNWLRLLHILPSSFFVGAVSWWLMGLMTTGTYAQIGKTVLVENGSRTYDGYILLIKQCIGMGMASIAGGIVFWLIIRNGGDKTELKF
jgi:hypothetical protein